MATATQRVRFDFMCDETPLTFHHDVPARLIGPAAAAAEPDFRALYMRTVAPVMQQRQGACLAACARRCGVCEARPASQVLTTPMSYLHLADEPRVVVIVTPVCAESDCATRGQREASAIVAEVAGMAEGVVNNNNNNKTPRGGPCPCGSRRKFKKCCGADGEGAEAEAK